MQIDKQSMNVDDCTFADYSPQSATRGKVRSQQDSNRNGIFDPYRKEIDQIEIDATSPDGTARDKAEEEKKEVSKKRRIIVKNVE